jgi:hypothetical protein
MKSVWENLSKIYNLSTRSYFFAQVTTFSEDLYSKIQVSVNKKSEEIALQKKRV